jgi:hypothetical protein
VIAAFLRSYNDHVDDERCQDLYRYAARVAGTRADADVERRRSNMCVEWARACCHRPELRVRILHRLLRYCQGPDVHAVYAARAAALTPGAHPRTLALLDELIDMDRGRRSIDTSFPPHRAGSVADQPEDVAVRVSMTLSLSRARLTRRSRLTYDALILLGQRLVPVQIVKRTEARAPLPRTPPGRATRGSRAEA